MEQESTSGLRAVAKRKNLELAWIKLNKTNKKSSGLDGVTIGHFSADLPRKLSLLSKDLLEKKFQFLPLRAVAIPKDDTRRDGDKRPLRIPAVKDRIVLKALQLYLVDPLERFNAPFSYAYRSKGGIVPAIIHAHHLAAKFPFVLHADIKKYFDNVDREKLLSVLLRIQRFTSLEWLLKAAIALETDIGENISHADQWLFEDDERGIPQGSALSPLLANLFLSYFDLAMADKGWSMVRYADDVIIFAKTISDAQKAYDDALVLLKGLSLDLHPLSDSADSKTCIRDIRSYGVDFVGLRVHNGHIFPGGRAIRRFRDDIESISNVGTIGQGIRRGALLGKDTLITRAMMINLKVEGKVASLACSDECQEIIQLDQVIRRRYLGMFQCLGATIDGANQKLIRNLGVPDLLGLWKSRRDAYLKRPLAKVPSQDEINKWAAENRNFLRRVFDPILNSENEILRTQ